VLVQKNPGVSSGLVGIGNLQLDSWHSIYMRPGIVGDFAATFTIVVRCVR
jgi:hypothetical protein